MIKPKRRHKKPEIDLDGPEGNAFGLLGKANFLAKQMGKDGTAIVAEMMAGDYEQLIKIFDREFGELVDLVRTKK